MTNEQIINESTSDMTVEEIGFPNQIVERDKDTVITITLPARNYHNADVQRLYERFSG